MPRTSLVPGLTHLSILLVTEDLTVPKVSNHLEPFQGMPPVFATAFMVAFVEATCIECIREHLDDGEQTVGTHVDLSHVSATPIGLIVAASVRLVQIEARRLRFEVECRDEVDAISRGFHERSIIVKEKFLDRIKKKSVSVR